MSKVSQNIVAIAVEKVQKYIFQRIDSSREDGGTLREVILASHRVEKDIINDIRKMFDIKTTGCDENLLLCISGKTVFRSNEDGDKILDKLSELSCAVYHKYEGNIILNCVVFQSAEDCLNVIKEADRRLKSDHSLNSQIVARIQSSLFGFCETNREEREKMDLESASDFQNNPSMYSSDVFVQTMDDLVYSEKAKENPNGRIAIVKADINNLGRMMSRITTYEKYLAVSKILADAISVDGLARRIEDYTENSYSSSETRKQSSLRGKILPFYVAGDDIFFAAKIGAFFDCISMLHRMIQEVNREVKSLLESDDSIELSIAIGTVFVNSHQPLRYYRQRVETELAQAKWEMKTNKSINASVGLSVDGSRFYIYQGHLGTGERDSFLRFCAETRELKLMLKNGLFTRAFMHNLMATLESEEDDEKMMRILYILRPTLRVGEDINDDVYFKYYWLSQLVEDGRGGRKERFFEPTKIKVVLSKLKLILLFLKEEYTDFAAATSYQYLKPNNESRSADMKKNIRSVMFHKPINYLFSLINPSDRTPRIESHFVRIKVINSKRIYQTAQFDVSFFHRAKDLYESGRRKRIDTLFSNYYESMVKERESEENVHRIKFDLHGFLKKLKLETDCMWLDRLIVFYLYNNQRIILKSTEKRRKEISEIHPDGNRLNLS